MCIECEKGLNTELLIDRKIEERVLLCYEEFDEKEDYFLPLDEIIA